MKFSSKKIKKSKYDLYTINVNEMISNLTEDDLNLIFSFSKIENLIKFSTVNKIWYKLISENKIWKNYFEKNEFIKINKIYSIPSNKLSDFEKCKRRFNCLERVKESLIEFIKFNLFEKEFYENSSLFKNLIENDIFNSDTDLIDNDYQNITIMNEFKKRLIFESNLFGEMNKIEEIWDDENESIMIYTGYICNLFVEIKIIKGGKCFVNFMNEIGNNQQDSIDTLTSLVSNNFKI